MRYKTRYVHKISPSEKDTGPTIDIDPTVLESKTKLGAALRDAGVLPSGGRIGHYRIESDQVVVFPQASIWHSILLQRA
jgi:hypothetical protein